MVAMDIFVVMCFPLTEKLWIRPITKVLNSHIKEHLEFVNDGEYTNGLLCYL
jgi:hypothetical protein